MDKLLQVFVLTDVVGAVVLKKLLKELCHHIYFSDAKSYSQIEGNLTIMAFQGKKKKTEKIIRILKL